MTTPPGQPPAQRASRRWRAWGAYAALAGIVAVAVTVAAPLWFRDDDAAFLHFAHHHSLAEAFAPGAGAVQSFYRPVTVAASWLAYRAFGLTGPTSSCRCSSRSAC